MSEFEIERPAKAEAPRLGLNASGETDADGGGGTTFLFHGGGGAGGNDQKGKDVHRAPVPIGPPVELSLSSAANMDMGGERVPGDFGPFGGPVLPPPNVAGAVEKALGKAKSLDDGSKSPEPGAAPGSLLNIEV